MVTYKINSLLSCYLFVTLFRGYLVSQFWQDSISQSSIFAILAGKYEKRVLNFFWKKPEPIKISR